MRGSTNLGYRTQGAADIASISIRSISLAWSQNEDGSKATRSGPPKTGGHIEVHDLARMDEIALCKSAMFALRSIYGNAGSQALDEAPRSSTVGRRPKLACRCNAETLAGSSRRAGATRRDGQPNRYPSSPLPVDAAHFVIARLGNTNRACAKRKMVDTDMMDSEPNIRNRSAEGNLRRCF